MTGEIRRPLSAAQRGIWYAQQLDPRSPAYQVAHCVEFSDGTDQGHLVTAVTETLREADGLGMRFGTSDGAPWQEVADPRAQAQRLAVDVVDVASADEAMQWMRRDLGDGGAPPQLEAGVLHAQALLRVDGVLRYWYQRCHHIAVDAYGMSLLERRVAERYTRLVEGREPPVARFAPISEFLDEDVAYRTSEQYETDAAAWTGHVARLPGAHADAPNGPRVPHRSAFVVDADTASSLRAVGAQAGRSWVEALIATAGAFFARFGHEPTTVVGVPVMSRSTDVARRTPTTAVNILPAILEIAGSQTPADLTRMVAAEIDFVRRHHRFRTDEVRGGVGGRGAGDIRPLVNIKPPAAPLSFGQAQGQVHFLASGHVDDLSLTVVPRDSGELELTVDGNPDRYDEADVALFGERFIGFARRFHAGTTVAQVGVLAPGEYDVHPPAPSTIRSDGRDTIVGLVAGHSGEDSTAVTHGHESCSYAELHRRSNRLAHHLVASGIGTNDVVALSLPRSIDLIVGILGVLKSGGIYLPIDPGTPDARRELLIRDARPAYLLDDIASLDLSDQPETAPDVRIDPEDGAYIIYTSGSTGVPKGVLVTHRNVVRLLESTAGPCRFDETDVWTMVHSYAFDFSVWEIWGALAHGGRLVVVPHDVARSPEHLAQLLRAEQVTVLDQTPSAFYQLAAVDDGDDPMQTVRMVILGGEKLELARLKDWFIRHPTDRPELVNMYGITEITVHATFHVVGDDGDAAIIGEPLADLAVHVLDRYGHPVPHGVTGELFIAGPGLARGYLRQPGLTARRFVADPFGPPGSRMYASGDLGRRRADGLLEYLGRADHQVKVRGYRVDPAEVTATVLEMPSVADAAVVTGDAAQLWCYVVPRPGHDLTRVDAREFLLRRLPEYMVPAVVLTDALPLTANGKLDVSALPAPSGRATEDVAATPVEQAICGLFENVLEVDGVAPDDNFFALGGHSLLITELVGRIGAVLENTVDLRTAFEHPTPRGLARHVDAARRPRLTRHERGEFAELSAAQRSLWFLDRVSGPTATYNLPVAIDIAGPVDATALSEAMADVCARHEILRTVFGSRKGTPAQQIGRSASSPFAVMHPEPGTDLREVLVEEACRGFDLANEPPVRVTMFPLAETRTVVLVCLHHIAGDEWSLRPLIRDLGEAYEARTDGRAPSWEPLPVQYADFAVWQNELLDEIADGDLTYWRESLAGVPERLELPTDFTRPAEATHRGDRLPVEIGAEDVAALRAIGRRHGASLFMVVHAVFATLLTRLGAGDDITIGTPVAARNDPALTDLVGYLVNTLVLRSDASGDPTFDEFLTRTTTADLGAYAHQETPFELVVEACNPVRAADRHPLFQVMLSLTRAQAATRFGEHGEATVKPVHTGTEKFDLTLNLAETDGGIRGHLEYATDLFARSTVERIVGYLGHLIGSVIGDSGRRLSELDVLGAAERRRIVDDWNDTDAPISPLTLPEMVSDQVRRTPDACAVSFAGRELTFDQLNRWANRLARHLRGIGVGPEEIVGILVPRSIEQIVALLAVLKSGGAFVPLEPSWPEERRTQIIRDAGLRAVITLGEPVGAIDDVAVDTVDMSSTRLDTYADDDLAVTIEMDSLAYVIYTSGSTGKPKGAMIIHRAVSNRLPWQVGLLGLGEADAVLYKAPLGFDISINEIFLPLVAGARLVVAEPGGERDMAYLLDLIVRQRITFVYLVSTMLELMLESAQFADAARSLRHVWCGGEVLTPALYERFTSHSDATMYHGYGPAEATIGVTCQVYRGADPAQGITIGRPNPNNRIYVLDEHRHPVPVGVPGQLFIGGVQLARGYLGDPDRTAAVFVEDPFVASPGSRMYATGDLARFRPDGNVEFLGRVDNQVKIRGMRVEPEEIEAILAQHPQVRQAVVVMRDAGLLAYCVPSGEHPASDELLRWTAERLPEHMVPAHTIVLEAFPLMPSGKVDRKALPEPSAQVRHDPERIAPRNDIEKAIAAAWSECLSVSDIGVRDNFFDLGGHSLILARIQIALQRELGHAVPIMDLFRNPTVESLADHLSGNRVTSGSDALRMMLPIRSEGGAPPLFCVHPASGLGWAFSSLRRNLPADVPVYALQARGLDSPAQVAESVPAMAGEYVDEILEVQPSGPYRIIGWSFGGVLAHEMAIALQDRGHEVELLGMLDSYPAYPWEKLAADYQQQALRSLLYMSHYDLDLLPDGPLDRDAVMAIVDEQGGVLAELGQDSITAVINTFVNSVVLQRQAQHKVFDGDLLFFTATVNRIDPRLNAHDWAPYVSGDIRDVPVPCEHKDMCQAGPIAVIGRILEEQLSVSRGAVSLTR
ncbi:amino acid adenylation domain-containing protein [Streptomyces sp. SID6673]|nr:amino acid adenylation domain-containing protein [Streptomyces sp. SID11726]NEB26362.1 amino acid adenylation domain-containing protein [Streptomyces sp. SID6673]